VRSLSWCETVAARNNEKPCTGGPESERSYRWPPRLGISRFLFLGVTSDDRL
jgi:hypothetical protein